MLRVCGLCAALLAFAAAASAGTVGALAAALETALHDARTALPATHLTRTQRSQRAAIDASLRTLARDTPTIDSEYTLAATALRPLHSSRLLEESPIHDGVASFESLLAGNVAPRRDVLAKEIANLPAGPVQDKPNRALQSADRLLAAAQTAPDAWVAVVDLVKAVKAVEKGEKIVAKSKWLDLSAAGTPVRFPRPRASFRTISELTNGNWTFQYFYWDGVSPGTSVLELTVANVTAPGAYAVLPSSGSYAAPDPAHNGSSLAWGGTDPGGTIGTVTFTAWDQGNHKCAGSMDITMTSRPPGAAPDLRITGTFSDGNMILNRFPGK